jgi:hypothetical protein
MRGHSSEWKEARVDGEEMADGRLCVMEKIEQKTWKPRFSGLSSGGRQVYRETDSEWDDEDQSTADDGMTVRISPQVLVHGNERENSKKGQVYQPWTSAWEIRQPQNSDI